MAISKNLGPNLKLRKKEFEIEKERREIKLIEDAPLGLQDKEELLLVYLKVKEKPAAWFPGECRFSKTETEEKQQKILDGLNQKREEIKKLTEKLGLPAHVEEFKTEEEKTINAGFSFLVGQDLEKLNRLKEALKSGSIKDIGLALGYPESAVEGFVKGEIFDIDKDLKRLPKKEKEQLKEEGVFKFLIFGFSKDNWREELESVRKSQRAIREKSPKIYDEIIKSAQDPFTFQTRIKTSLERILNKIEYYKRGFRK